MWNVVLPRAIGSFGFLCAFLVAVNESVPDLGNPLTSSLVAVATLLLLLRSVEQEVQRSARFRTRVLMIGRKPIAQKFIDEIEVHRKHGYTIIGLVDETSSRPQECGPYLVLGTIDELQTIVRAVQPDRIILALSERRGRMPANQLLEFQMDGIIVEDVVDAYERLSGKLAIEALTPCQLISSQGFGNHRTVKAIQRVVSFAAALVGLLLLAPALGLIALAIKLDSPGPVLFRQKRLGRRGRPFQLIKFRTMQPIDHPTSEWAKDNLERITNVGRWLRRFRLDELPQLVNVIPGDMNLVGPRPHPVCNFPLFREAIPYYILRGSVRPGITGWAQVRYRYAENLEEETEKMRYDLYYIKHMSLWMDLRILFDTCVIFLSGFASFQVQDRRNEGRLLRHEPARLRPGWNPELAARPRRATTSSL